MGVLERRAREKEALRTKILDAASSLIVEEGYENLSIRRIAERIEYSPATIYLYFKDKAQLVAAICEEAFAEMLETIGKARESTADALEGLRRGLRAYIDFGIHHPSHYLIVFGMPGPGQQQNTICEGPTDLGMQTFDLLRQGIQACIDGGAIPPSDIETASRVTWMTIHGITSMTIMELAEKCPDFPSLDREQLIESALDIVIAGLRNCTLRSAVR
jgi:AcrR family transcriptional regulator